jgi:poly(A)-specific ribonuclease
MGFSLIVEMLIRAKKPLIGHNMMYDVIYLYNQFIGDLPETYLEFAKEWYSLFPALYDNKVLSSAAEYFGRTDLGKVFEKCQNDERLKPISSKIVFDKRGGFTNYDGTELLSHYHEAGYDAYMTGVCFASILKYKETDKGKSNASTGPKAPGEKGKGKGKVVEETKVETESPPVEI